LSSVPSQLGCELGCMEAKNPVASLCTVVRQFHERDVQVHFTGAFQQKTLKCHQIDVVSQNIIHRHQN